MADLLLTIKLKTVREGGAAISGLRDELTGLAKASKQFNRPSVGGRKGGVGRIGTQARRAGTDLEHAARGMADLGRSSERLLRGPINAATQYETSLADIRTLTDEATFSTDDLRRITQESSKQFGGTAPDQAGALYDIISAGAKDATEAQGTLTAANKLAIGGLTDVGNATSAISAVTANFRQENIDSAQAADALFSIVKKGRTTLDQTARAFPKAASAAGGIKLPLAEAAGAFATLTLTTKSSSVAATQFSALIAATEKPTIQAEKALKKLNRQRRKAGLDKVDITSGGLREKGVAGFAAQFQGVDDKTLAQLFGSKQARAAVIAFRDNIDGLNSAITDAKNSSGAAEKAFATQSKTRAQRLKILEANLDSARLAIGEAVAPIVDELTPSLVGVAEVAADLARDHPGIVKAAGALAVAAVGFGKVGQGIVGVSRTVNALKGAADLASPAVKGLAGLVGGPGRLGMIGAVGALTFAAGTFVDDWLGLSDKLVAGIGDILGTGDTGAARQDAGQLAKDLAAGGKREVQDAAGNVITDPGQLKQLRAQRKLQLVLGGQDADSAEASLLSEGFARQGRGSGISRLAGRAQSAAQDAARGALDVKITVDSEGKATITGVTQSNFEGDVDASNGEGVAI